jgi:ABC-type glycerol-3-phosphate transport system permease component
VATATQPQLALAAGAVVFLFPFYYMVVGALQREPNSDVSGAFPNPANLTLDNLTNINRPSTCPAPCSTRTSSPAGCCSAP